MRVLIFSDSHSSLRFMRRCVEILKPDALIHLGDHYDDGEAIGEEYPHLALHQVAGNCDRYRCPIYARTMLCYEVGGVRLFMAHGHEQRVKQGIGALLTETRRYGAAAALYGHTHIPDCHREEDGLWVLNPGSCGYDPGSAGLIETENRQIKTCRLITPADLEEAQ
ncbi:MAG: YfcE family phosphodiesterase [Oscillospiraceae bacterium]|nr:YfcE family phosphodiesterase [Oscillospiraceae bacterium]